MTLDELGELNVIVRALLHESGRLDGGFGEGGRVHSQGMQVTLEAGQGKKTDSPCRASRRNTVLMTPYFSPVSPIVDFELQNYKIITSVLFKQVCGDLLQQPKKTNTQALCYVFNIHYLNLILYSLLRQIVLSWFCSRRNKLGEKVPVYWDLMLISFCLLCAQSLYIWQHPNVYFQTCIACPDWKLLFSFIPVMDASTSSRAFPYPSLNIL